MSRSGGFAGTTRRGEIDTRSRPDAAVWDELTAGIDLVRLPSHRPEPDRFVYRISIDGNEAVVGESDLSDRLRRLVERVLAESGS